MQSRTPTGLFPLLRGWLRRAQIIDISFPGHFEIFGQNLLSQLRSPRFRQERRAEQIKREVLTAELAGIAERLLNTSVEQLGDAGVPFQQLLVGFY